MQKVFFFSVHKMTQKKMYKSLKTYRIIFNFFFFFSVIEMAKGQQKLLTGIESFDPAKLKHTETLEKNPLPTKESKTYIFF